jgi:predicted glycosyltransferase
VKIKESLHKTILVAPLNWGLGHASRCVPIINALLKNRHRVILASDGVALELLKQEYPDLLAENLPSYGVTYPENGNFIWHVAKLIPSVLSAINAENAHLKELIKQHAIDVVISDNRYGMHNENVKSIFMTHQIKVASPLAEGILANIQKKYWQNFDELWIPDFATEPSVSGKLAHNEFVPETAKYLGCLSRFTDELESLKPENLNDDSNFILAVVSGPEPQRTLFEKVLLQQLSSIQKPVVIVGGNPNSKKIKTSKNITHYPFLKATQLKWLFQHSEAIISRSGYSTIMDLIALKKKAILIPTPGQTEQEYLVEHLKYNGLFYTVSQKDFNVVEALKGLESLPENIGFTNVENASFFSEVLNTI